MRRTLVSALVGAAVAAAVAWPVLATHVPPHEHYMVTETGKEVLVGPPVCDHPEAYAGFHQFHNRVHQGIKVPTEVLVTRVCPTP